jgi:hypothetical protein
MYALLAIAVLAALAMGSAKKASSEPSLPAAATTLDKDELAALYAKNPQLYTAMTNALQSPASNPAELYGTVVWLASNGFPKTATMVMAQYNARTQKVAGKSGKAWRTWVNTFPSPTLTQANIDQGWKETHVLIGDGGMFEGQRILVYGEKGGDPKTRALGGIWSPIPDGVTADTVPAAKSDFGLA